MTDQATAPFARRTPKSSTAGREGEARCRRHARLVTRLAQQVPQAGFGPRHEDPPNRRPVKTTNRPATRTRLRRRPGADPAVHALGCPVLIRAASRDSWLTAISECDPPKSRGEFDRKVRASIAKNLKHDQQFKRQKRRLSGSRRQPFLDAADNSFVRGPAAGSADEAVDTRPLDLIDARWSRKSAQSLPGRSVATGAADARSACNDQSASLRRVAAATRIWWRYSPEILGQHAHRVLPIARAGELPESFGSRSASQSIRRKNSASVTSGFTSVAGPNAINLRPLSKHPQRRTSTSVPNRQPIENALQAASRPSTRDQVHDFGIGVKQIVMSVGRPDRPEPNHGQPGRLRGLDRAQTAVASQSPAPLIVPIPAVQPRCNRETYREGTAIRAKCSGRGWNIGRPCRSRPNRHARPTRATGDSRARRNCVFADSKRPPGWAAAKKSISASPK